MRTTALLAMTATLLWLMLTGCTGSRPDRAQVEATAAALAQLEATAGSSRTPGLSVAPTTVPTPLLSELVKDVTPSIVRVRGKDTYGTGFVAFQAGQVLTALHVVGDVAFRPTVLASDGTVYRAVVFGADAEKGLVLLLVPKLQAPPLTFASQASVGDSVIAVGYAAGLPGEPSITKGIISAKRVEPTSGLMFLQTDAPLNPGNSGGPILNERGGVVGVNMTKAQYEGMGFALSAKDVLAANDLREGTVRLLPTPEPLPTVIPPEPAATPFVVRQYPERQADGRVYLVKEWSDGRFTVPLFVLFESVTNPVAPGELVTVSLLTKPGATCHVFMSIYPQESLGVFRADESGMVRWTYRMPILPEGTAVPIYAQSYFGGDMIQDYRIVLVRKP